MAQLVIAAAGAAIGGMIAPGIVAFGMTGASIGWMAGSMIGSAFAPTQKSSGPQLSDLSVSTSAYGTPIPYVQGHPRIAGQIVWASTKREIATTTEQGKGGGGSEYTSYTYEVDLLILLTDNQIAGVPRVWKNGDLVYNILADTDPTTVDASLDNGGWSRFTTYTGGFAQLPDPDYEAAVGTGNAPAYRGRGAVFIKSLQLGNSGQIPNLTFELVVDGIAGVGGAASVSWSDSPPDSVLSPSDFTDQGNMGLHYLEGLAQFAFWKTNFYLGTTVKHSTADGVTWSEVLVSNNAYDGTGLPLFKKIQYGAGKYVAVNGNPDTAITSPWYSTDGNDWAYCTFTPSASEDTVKTITFGGGKFIAAGTPSGTSLVYSSSDGIAFTQVATVSFGGYEGLEWTGTNYVMVSNRHAAYSPDGVSWSVYWIDGSTTWSRQSCLKAGVYLTYSNAAVAQKIGISTDNGESFTVYGASAMAGHKIMTIWSDGINFNCIARQDVDLNYYLFSSIDGISWVPGGLLDDPYQADRYRPVSNGAGLSLGITNVYDKTPKRTFIYGFSESDTISIVDTSVSSVVQAVASKSGLTATQFDVTALAVITRPVRSMAISSVSSARTVLDMLAQSYHFEAVLSDKIYFRPRASAPAATLTFNELGVVVDSGSTPDPLPLTQANELEIPAQMALTYSNVDGDYQTDTQYSDRLLTGQESTSAMQVPLGFTATEAKQIVDAMLLDKAVSALTASVSLGVTRAALEPTDVVLLTGEDGSSYRMRIVKKAEASGVTTLECVQDDSTVFTQVGTTTGGTASQTTVLATPTTTLELLDVPLLRDVDNLPGHYVAVKGSAANWTSAGLYDSLDDLTFTPNTTISSQAVIGTCTTTLPDWAGGNVFDESSSVTVNVGTQQLSSVTRDDILASQSTNAALIGGEVLQYRTATLVSAGVYTLSGFLRGQRGTSSTGHVATERFIVLAAGGLRFIPLQQGDLGRVRYYKAASAGQKLSAVTSQSLTPAGITLKPFAPVDCRANRATADTVLTWIRQTRLSTRIVGTLGIGSPLGEAAEAYEVEIYTAGHALLKRTLTSSTPTVTYTSAMQVADFGSNQAALAVKIYQISATVGRGAPLAVTV